MGSRSFKYLADQVLTLIQNRVLFRQYLSRKSEQVGDGSQFQHCIESESVTDLKRNVIERASKESLESEFLKLLLKIKGVGEKSAQRLLLSFGTIEELKKASVEQIAAVPHIGIVRARNIKAGLPSLSISDRKE
jgi:ERCC4-type nuclease